MAGEKETTMRQEETTIEQKRRMWETKNLRSWENILLKIVEMGMCLYS